MTEGVHQSVGRSADPLAAAIFAGTPDAVVVVDADGHIQAANEAVERLFDHSIDELIGSPVELLLPERFHTAHRTHRTQFVQSPTRRPMGTGRSLWGRRRDGTEFPVDVSLGPLETGGPPMVVAVVRDITARLEAEASTAYLAFLVESSDDALLSIDAEGTIETWNRAAERLFGHAAPEVMRQPVSMLFPDHAWSEEALVLERVQAGERVERRDTVIVRADGALVPVSVTVSGMRDHHGRIVRSALLVRDRSEQSFTQQMLRESDARLLEAQSLARVGLWAWDVGTATMQLSGPMHEIMGLAPRSYDGLLTTFVRQLHPTDQTGFTAALERCRSEGEPLELELRAVRPNGEVRWLHVRGDPVHDGPGVIEGMRGIAQDVTDARRAEDAIRESEARYRALVELSPAAIVIAQSGILRYHNSAAAELFAVRSTSELVGRPLTDFGLSMPAVEDVPLSETVLQAANGEPIDVELRWSRIHVDGRPAAQIVLRDVTQQRRTEETLRRALDRERDVTERLREADRLKDDFLATVSHELRTPLTSIIGFAEVLAEGNPSLDATARHDLLRRIAHNGGEMHRMVERLLDYSRLEAGEISVNPQVVILGDALEGVLQRLAPLIARHRVQVSVPEGLAAVADPAALEHVVGNLVANSVKFGGASPRIEIEVVRDGDEVVVAVRDWGPGVDPAIADRIFDRFVQGPTMPAGRRGTGIGLAIARRYAELLGGRLWLENRPGEGATFLFSLAVSAQA